MRPREGTPNITKLWCFARAYNQYRENKYTWKLNNDVKLLVYWDKHDARQLQSQYAQIRRFTIDMQHAHLWKAVKLLFGIA